MRKYDQRSYVKCAICGKQLPFHNPYDSGWGWGTKAACSWSHQRMLERKYRKESPDCDKVSGNLTNDKHDMLIQMRRDGYSAAQIAEIVGHSIETVYRACARAGVPFGKGKVSA